jgi:dihydroxy-acid dehydratase
MDAKTFDKSKLPSRHVTEGPSRAPHRSYYYAMGLTEKQIHRPFVGVVSCWNEAAPCNIALMRQAQSAKKGVNTAGARASSAPSPSPTASHGPPGMKSSLVSRGSDCRSIELTMRRHCYDAMVGLAGARRCRA